MSFSSDLDRYLTTPNWGIDTKPFTATDEEYEPYEPEEDWLGNMIQPEDEIFEISFYEYKDGKRWKEYRIATAKSFAETKDDLAWFEVEYLGTGEHYLESMKLN